MGDYLSLQWDLRCRKNEGLRKKKLEANRKYEEKDKMDKMMNLWAKW